MRDQLQQPKPRRRSHTVASKVAIANHPIHPMLVVYPVALLTLVPVTDALYLWRDEAFWAQVSFWLTAVGFVAGVCAGLVGMADMFAIRVVRRHVSAWNHFIVAVMALALAGTGLGLRWPDPVAAIWPWGLLLGLATFVAVMVAGWLGGTLSFRHGIGVYGDEDDNEPLDDNAPPAA